MSVEEIDRLIGATEDFWPQFGNLMNANIMVIMYVLAAFLSVGFFKFLLRKIFKMANPYSMD